MAKKAKVVMVLFVGCIFMLAISNVYAIQCGDGKKEGLEECDDGVNNSDTISDACRTDCTRHKCGDGVRDSDEECDEGYWDNSNEIPGRCRTDCTEAKCGDGFLDFTEGELCDDGNDDGSDGCHNCYPCYVPKDNLVLSSNGGETFKICEGTYELIDKDKDGIIIVEGYGTKLDCTGVTLIGKSAPTVSAVSNFASLKTKKSPQKSTGSKIGMSKRVKPSDTGSSSSSSTQSGSGNSTGQSSQTPVSYRGTGIVVNGQDVIVMNCNIKGFEQGIKLNSTGAVLVNNKVCDNKHDIKSSNNQNFGANNSCTKCENWGENGQSGCTSSCN